MTSRGCIKVRHHRQTRQTTLRFCIAKKIIVSEHNKSMLGKLKNILISIPATDGILKELKVSTGS